MCRVRWLATALGRGTWQDRLLLGLVLALLLGPAVILVVGDRPSRFGFQMYSGYGDVTATWRDAAGTEHVVDLDDHLANARNEVDWTRSLPDDLCSRIPEAVAVQVRRTQPGTDQVRRVTC